MASTTRGQATARAPNLREPFQKSTEKEIGLEEDEGTNAKTLLATLVARQDRLENAISHFQTEVDGKLASIESSLNGIDKFLRTTTGIAPNAGPVTAKERTHISLNNSPAASIPSKENALTSTASRGVNSLRSLAIPQLREIETEYLGEFNPDYPDPEDLGRVYDGDKTIYTDVTIFRRSLEIFLEGPNAGASREEQLLKKFEAIISGRALIWWVAIVPKRARADLLSKVIKDVLVAFEDRFKLDLATAARRFVVGSLELRDILRNKEALQLFVQRKLRYAQHIGLLDESKQNWHPVVTVIWAQFDIDLKTALRPPTRKENIDTYLGYLGGATPNLTSIQRDRHYLSGRTASETSEFEVSSRPRLKRKALDETPREAESADPRTAERRNTCGHCNAFFNSRNRLFAHLRVCGSQNAQDH